MSGVMLKEEDHLFNCDHNSLIAPAGCGKTEEIVKAVSYLDGKQLILTHTNAGVASLKSRLRKLKVPNTKFNIDTIASWFLKYSAAYLNISGLTDIQPKGDGWRQVYTASHNLFQHKFIYEVIQATYSGAFIDEYQDCTLSQHELIKQLSVILPVRVLGDPLQGIFGFRDDDPLVDWVKDVEPIFKPLPELQIPWRWKNGNVKLGNWLLKLRHSIINSECVDLSSIPDLSWESWSVDKEIDICQKLLHKKGSVVGIQMWPQDAHASAKRLTGKYQSMEEMECKDLMKYAVIFDETAGVELGEFVVEFLHQCMVPEKFFIEIKQKLSTDNINGLLKIESSEIGFAFYKLIFNREMINIANIIDIVEHTQHLKIFRRELLSEMKRAIQSFVDEGFPSVQEAAFAIRDRTRYVGRKFERNSISRTLLIKGLEFDHVVILNADKFIGRKDFKQHFYVAATRGSQSLTILSRNPIIYFS